MVLIKEYRICMPLTVEEYRIGQLYMIARHSLEQSENGEGVETVINIPCEDEKYGKGQFTEKKIHLSNRLPYWLQSIIPKIFYITEKAWNYYPYTLTEYTCSFIPKLHVSIKTQFEDNRGESENVFDLSEEQLKEKIVDLIDISYDDVNPKYYKEEEDLKFFKSKKTNRGPLPEDWQKKVTPIMCSYKLVEVSFEVWGLQTKCEDLIQRSIRDILVLGHRQAFAWVDEWISMSLSDVRVYECEMQRQTNTKVHIVSETENMTLTEDEDYKEGSSCHNSSSSSKASSPASPKSPILNKAPKSWFSWE